MGTCGGVDTLIEWPQTKWGLFLAIPYFLFFFKEFCLKIIYCNLSLLFTNILISNGLFSSFKKMYTMGQILSEGAFLFSSSCLFTRVFEGFIFNPSVWIIKHLLKMQPMEMESSFINYSTPLWNPNLLSKVSIWKVSFYILRLHGYVAFISGMEIFKTN